MDVTFTNVLEGARQYFQGLPMGSGSMASPIYPGAPDVIQQTTNNEPSRSQESHPTPNPYWMSQTEAHHLSSREPTPIQRSASYSSDTSRPSSHSHYVNAGQEQRRTPSYPHAYPSEQQSVYHIQQQQQQQQQEFQFTRPQPNPYPSHILQNPAYHSSQQPTINQHHHSQTSTSNYSNYQQPNRTYYPSASYAELQPTTENKNYPTPRSYPYQQPQSNYYKNIYQTPTSSSVSSQYNPVTVNHVKQDLHPHRTGFNNTTRTHGIPSIPQLSKLNEVKTSQHYQQYSSISTVATTSITYNPATSSKSSSNSTTNTFSVQTLTSTQTTPKSIESKKPSTSSVKPKRESPLDLSVKTVRTPADSTLDDVENDRSQYFGPNRGNYPAYDPYAANQRTCSASAPKVDFLPNFNVSAMSSTTHSNYRTTATTPFQQQTKQAVANRYPIVSVPNVNNYMQSSNKTTSKVLPRIDFPTVGSNMKTSALYPTHHNAESPKKRPADTAPNLSPKVARIVETWRQTIDDQIDQKISTYKQTQQQQPPTIHNGNYVTATQYYQQVSAQQPFGMSQYHPHSTYVPTPTNSHAHQYNNVRTSSTFSPFNQNDALARGPPNSTTAKAGGAADKRVLTLLRNSIETKGVNKVSQRKHDHHDPYRSEVQQPSTHVTAPLQPKPVFMGRQNVSPFTPNSLPESNNTTPIYNKLNVPKAIDSINYDLGLGKGAANNKQLPETVISDQNNPNTDLDGLAAFLAARIRTKAELKQIGPAQQAQLLFEDQLLRTPVANEPYGLFNSGSSSSISPPKLSKELPSQQPRKRLFSRTEDDNGTAKSQLPSRDKSGMRSSSETSVFDFPDSGSDGEMPVLEMQSLNAMRRDRKSSVKQTSSTTTAAIPFETEPNSQTSFPPEDEIFLQACDTFMDQLKAGIGKKRGRRKKMLEPDVLAKLETVTKEKPLAVVKEEIPTPTEKRPSQSDPLSINLQLENLSRTEVIKEIIKSAPVSQFNLSTQLNVKKEIQDDRPTKVSVMVTPLATPAKQEIATQSELSDSDSETIKQLSNKLKNKSPTKTQVETEAKVKPTEIISPNKTPKKPAFGDGSAFYPGWEEGVYKYKKSLRMPASLIQVSRPPSALRHSTSLPDLDPCPSSPCSSIAQEKDEDSKSIFTKIKSEPIDSSDIESNSGFNLFSNRNNYDSEGSASIKSLPTPVKDSIVDKLLQKCGKRKKRKYKKKEEMTVPKIIPKSENPTELLPTPEVEDIDDKPPIVNEIEFRKSSTIENFKDAFLLGRRSSNVNEQFSTVILKSRTRKESRVLKQRATIKEVFGEDRPASAPPVTCINNTELTDDTKKEERDDKENETVKIGRTVGRPKTVKNNLLKSIADKKLLKTETTGATFDVDVVDEKIESASTYSEDIDSKSETFSLDGDDNSNASATAKKRAAGGRFTKIRRKFSSGFDYIRKKKKQIKKEIDASDEAVPKRKRRDPALKATPESEQDIQKEIKSWVLNKGVGETHLHRSARLGYTDITAFCLEKMDCSPSPKDNAGYTPLHEACSRGHLDIARLLLMYGANVSESAKGGIRPLHEAVENGFLEIIRLLLSYGADPKLATYAGLTPLSLATDDATKELLQNHMNDLEGVSNTPWTFYGPSTCFEPKEIGYSVLSSPPRCDSTSEEEDIEIEESECLLPNLYTLRGEAHNERWVLLQDLSAILKVKSREALLKQLCPSPTTTPSSSNGKTFLKELKMSEFLEQAHCCQFLNASEKVNSRASKVALVRYTDKIRELLKVELVVISAR